MVDRIVTFLDTIGLPTQTAAIPGSTFLPGIAVQNGILTFDPEKLLWPGDLLHEAGHLAILPPEDRTRTHGPLGDDGGFEMAAIAWSWAAAHHLEIPPSALFHEHGYKGGSHALIGNFSEGRYIGVPLLRWMGMLDPEKPYPALRHWLRQSR